MSDLVVVPEYADRWIVITGIRDLDYALGKGIVVHKLGEIVQGHPPGIIFGGARGVDTVALWSAYRARGGAEGLTFPKLVVIVPGRVAQQPKGAQVAIRTCADEVIELNLPLNRPGSFHKRNEVMLITARERNEGLPQQPLCVGFTDDTDPRAGGTASTMGLAKNLGIEVVHVPTPRMVGGVD